MQKHLITILSSSKPKYSKLIYFTSIAFWLPEKDYFCDYSTDQNFSEDANIMPCSSGIQSYNSEVIKFKPKD